MTTVIRTTKRKRGVFDTLVWWLFLAFNILMAVSLTAGLRAISDQYQSATESAARVGTAIGGTLASGVVLGFWLIGALILGLIVALTRGKTVTIEKIVE